MQTEKRGRGRPPGEVYPERVQVYETEEGKRLLKGLALRHGESESAVVRRLIREAAKREGVK